MALTFVQSKTAASAGVVASISAVFTSPPTQDNLLVAVVNSDNTVTMTSSGWTLVTSAVDFTGMYQWYKVAGSSESSTVTASPTTSDGIEIYVVEYSGGLTTGVLDRSTSNVPATNATSIASGTTAATTQADELAIAHFGWNESTGNINVTATSVTGSYTIDVAGLRGLGAANTALAVVSKALVATATQAATATLSALSGHPVGLIATYKAAAAPADATTKPAVAGMFSPQLVEGMWF